MQITIDLPDNLPLTEADVRIELAMVLDQQYSLSLDRAAQLAAIINLKAVPKNLLSAQILSI
jgi:predicted HTH domain antitoxin